MLFDSDFGNLVWEITNEGDFPLFSLFQKLSTITEVMEEIFEVNIKEDIEDMDLCDFTQNTLKTLAPPKNHRLVTSAILTTPSEVHSSTPSSK